MEFTLHVHPVAVHFNQTIMSRPGGGYPPAGRGYPPTDSRYPPHPGYPQQVGMPQPGDGAAAPGIRYRLPPGGIGFEPSGIGFEVRQEKRLEKIVVKMCNIFFFAYSVGIWYIIWCAHT